MYLPSVQGCLPWPTCCGWVLPGSAHLSSDGGWAFALALLLGLPGYALGRFGAGDVKLLAALGLATHTEYLLWSLIGSAVAMSVWVVMRQGLSARVVHHSDQASRKQPFAPYLLTGFIACWLWIH